MKRFIFFPGCMVSLCSGSGLHAQEGNRDAGMLSVRQMRANKNYEFLNEHDSVKLFLKPVKWIPISQENIYLTLSGQYRPRFE